MTPLQLAKNGYGPTPGAFGDNLTLVQGVDTDHDISIGVGSCGDSTGVYKMRLFAALIKQIDAAFAEGTNAGGMFTGAVAATTWYHVHLIRRDSDGHIDGGYDTSPVAANRPVGYTAYCRIGAVLTDGSSNIIAFKHYNDTFKWVVGRTDYNGNPPDSITLVTVSIPLGVAVEVLIDGQFYGTVAVGGYYAVLGVDSGNGAAILPIAPVADKAMSEVGTVTRSNTASQIQHVASSILMSVFLYTYGWIDPRGKVAA